jgi:hypothetical protein
MRRAAETSCRGPACEESRRTVLMRTSAATRKDA